MKSAVTMLLQSLAASRRLMLDSVWDLSALELAGRPSPALRSCVRLLGMAAVADREVLRLLGVVDLPDLPAGFEARFAGQLDSQFADVVQSEGSESLWLHPRHAETEFGPDAPERSFRGGRRTDCCGVPEGR